VFHISQLKPYKGSIPAECPLQLPDNCNQYQPVLSPLEILGQRQVWIKNQLVNQVLVQWQGLLPEDTSWEDTSNIQSQFPELHLEDKVVFNGSSIDTDQGCGPTHTNSNVHSSLRRTKRIHALPGRFKDYEMQMHS
ncbi:Chromo domain-containing protein, partial [Cephalotus follicularis]